MEKKLLNEEINRIKKLMLLEGPGSGIMDMFRTFQVFWTQKNKICDDLSDAGVDDSVVNTLRGKGNMTEFADELYNQLDTLSKSTDLGETSQFHMLLKGLSKSLNLETKFDDVLKTIKDANKTDVEKGSEKTTFLANFRDAEIQDFFKKNIDQIESDFSKKFDVRTLKGQISTTLENITMDERTLDVMLEGLPLSKAEKIMISRGGWLSFIGEDLYNFAKQIHNVTLTRGVKILNEQEKLVESVYNRLVNVINKLEKNNNFTDAEKQFALIWNEINNMRLLFQRTNVGGQITIGDKQWTSDLFQVFIKTLEKQKVPYETINKLKNYWETASPTTRKTWNEKFKETRFGKILYGPKSKIGEFLTSAAQSLTKPIFRLLDYILDFLLSGSFNFNRKEMGKLFYKNGILLPKGWRKLRGKKILPRIGGQYITYSRNLLLASYVIIPYIVNFILLIYDLFVNIFKTEEDQGTLERVTIRFLLSPITYINRQMEESGVFSLIKDIISKLLFPFNPLIDDLFEGVVDILTEAKDVTIKNTDEMKKKVNSWIQNIWIKIRDFYDNLKVNTKRKIQEIETSTNSTESQNTIPAQRRDTIPAERRDSIPPVLQDTIPAEIDTSGGFQPA